MTVCISGGWFGKVAQKPPWFFRLVGCACMCSLSHLAWAPAAACLTAWHVVLANKKVNTLLPSQ
jgi:hypothetical protein